jgi:hypothetical protein
MKLGETGSKDLKKFQDYGIDLSDLQMGGPLLEDAIIRVTFQQDRITLLEDALFAMTDYEVLLQKGSWINGAEDEHEMQFRITCGPKLQEKLTVGAVKAVGKDFFEMVSTGRLSKPNVKLDVKRLMNRLIEGVSGGLLDGLLNK